MKIMKIVFLLVICAIFSGCAKNLQPGSYDANEVGKVKKVVPGIILSKRPINIVSKKSDTMESTEPATIRRSHGFEYVIKLNDGDIVSIAQDEDMKLKTKQHVLVIYGTNTRVVADDGSDD